MRKFITSILTVLCFILASTYANAQLITNYSFATNATGSLASDMNSNVIDMSTGTTTLIGASSLAGAGSGLVNIGFDFLTMGTRNTQISVSANGWLGIGASLTGSGNGWLGGGTAGLPRVAPFLVNTTAGGINFAMGTSSTGKVHSKIVGTSPNRTFVIEYLNMQINSVLTGASADATFQARIYEATGVMEFVYGSMSVGAGSATVFGQVGWSNTTIAYSSVNTATHTASNAATTTQSMAAGTITDVSSVANGSRRVYRYTPNPLPAPTALAFTAITQTSYSLNWVDASTGELGFEVYRSTDGINYTFMTRTAANAVTFAATGLLPGTNYDWRVTAVLEGPSAALPLSQATLPATVKTSAGTGLWSVGATWSPAGVPAATDDVVIANGHTVTIDVTTAVCNNLTVGQGVSGILEYQATPLAGLTVSGNVTVAVGGSFTAGSGSLTTHTLGIGGTATTVSAGSLLNNGVFDMNITAGVTTTFFGNANGSVSGSGGTTDFWAIVVNKGTTQTGATLDVTSVITQNIPAVAANRLVITAGTFKLSSATAITPYYGSQTINTANGRLWINNAGASIQCVGTGIAAHAGAGSPTVSGELRIDNGLFGYGIGNNTLTFTSGSGVLRMSNGTLNMFGGVSFPTSALTQFFMSGGNINVDPQVGASVLAASTPVFSIGALTTVDWTGGNINIIDPHSAVAGTAWTASSGGAKNIAGTATLNIGDGVSTTTTAAGNTGGFGLLSTMPLQNLIINNRTDASTTRMARMTGGVTMLGTLTVSANAYLFLGSSTTTQTLTLFGSSASVINNGTMAGTEPAGTQNLGTLYSLSTSGGAQTLSGSGTFVNMSTISIDNQGSGGLVLSNSNPFRVRRVNLFDGSLNPGANLIVGNPTSAASEQPIIQYGGAATLNTGTFTALPTLDETEGQRSLFYSSSLSVFTMGFNGEIGTGAQTITQLLVNNATGLTIPADRTINIGGLLAGTLTMTLGNINLNAGTLTLGASAAAPGTLTWTSGFITSGNFKRWYPTTGLPTTAGTSIGYYPMASGPNNRQVQLFFNSATALSTGGTITVGHNNVSGLTTIPGFVDGAITVDRRSNTNWVLTAADGIAATGTISLAVRGDLVANAGNVVDLRLIRATDAVGTTAVGTGTTAAPVLNRTGLTIADVGNTFYMGSTTANLNPLYIAIASANWGENSTWDTGVPPGPADAAVIPSPFNVTVAGSITPYQAGSLIINSGGTLTAAANTLGILGNLTNNGTVLVSGGIVNVGITDNSFCNRTFTNNGTLNVSAGNLNIYGNINIASGSTFIQSGGTIRADGNAAGVTANSVLTGTPIFRFNNTTSTLSGGTIIIVDPHVGAGSTDESFSFSGAANISASTSHTVQFGDGVSTDATTNTNGFLMEPFVGSFRLMLGNLVLNTVTSAGNRHVTNQRFTGQVVQVLGDMTITTGEDRTTTGTLSIAGNLSNSGTLTATGTLAMSSGSGTSTLVASANAQTISGGGTFQNLSASPTANLTSLNINNTHATGVTLNLPLSASGTLTMTSGKLNTTTTNILRLGTATAAGTLSGGSSTAYITGPFARTFAASRTATGTYTATTLFPVGKGASYLPIHIDPSTSSGGALTMSGEAFTTNPGTPGPGVTSLSSNRWEALATAGSGNILSTFIRLNDAAIVATNNMLQTDGPSGTYTGTPVSSVYAAGTPNTLTTGSAIPGGSFKGYLAYGDMTPCALPANQPTGFMTSLLGATSFTGSFTAATSAPSNYLVVRYATPPAVIETPPVDFTAYTLGASLGTGTVVSISGSTTFNQTGLVPNTTYHYYIYSYNNAGCSGPVYRTASPLIGIVTTCAAVTGTPGTPTSSAITSTGFTASWTASSTPGVTYEMDVATDAGFTSLLAGYNPFNAGALLTANVTGLSASTTYYVRVRALISGCYSVNTSTLIVITACNPVVSLPWTEGFESLATFGAGVVPLCWSTQLVSGANFTSANAPIRNGLGARTGTNYVWSRWSSEAWLYTPGFNLTGGTSYDFSYYYRQTDAIAGFTVTTAYGSSATSGSMTNTLGTITDPVSTAYAQAKFTFVPASTGTYYFGVRSNSPTSAPWYLTFDDFELALSPPCPAPTSVSISSVTSSTASVNFTSGGTSFIVNYGPAGFTPGTGAGAGGGTVVTGGSSPIPISGLAAQTTYDVYVRQVCTGPVYSANSSVVSFTTLCAAVTTFTENWDAVTAPAFPACFYKVGALGSANTQTTNPNSAPNTLYIFSGSGTSQAVVALRPVSNAGANTHQLRFKARANFTAGGILEVGYLTDPLNAATFTLVQSFTIPTLTYSEFTCLPGTAPGSNQVLAFRNNGAPAFSILVDDVIWELQPTCPAPTGLSVLSTTPTTAQVSFTSPGGSFIVEYGATGFTPGTGAAAGGGTVVTGASSPINISGLTASTTYQVYVRRECIAGVDYSTNTGPVSFTTGCSAVGVPYLEDFESLTDPGVPACISVQNVNGNTTWRGFNGTAGQTATSGTKSIRYDWNTPIGADDWFYTRALSLTGGTSYRLSFNYKASDGPAWVERLEVKYGTGSIASSMTLGPIFTDNNIANSIATPFLIGVVDFTPSVTGNYYIGFHCTSIADQAFLYVDDVAVNLTPACPAPTAVSVSSITSTSASVSFASPGTSFIVEYGATGFVPGTAGVAGGGTVVTGPLSPIALSGLTPGTTYDVYVRQDCGGGTFSSNSSVISFTTLCTAVTSYTENWDGVSPPAFPSCFYKVGGGGFAYTQASSANSAPNSLYMFSADPSNAVVSLRPVSNAGANTHQLRFMARAGSAVGGVLQVGYLTNPVDAATFTLLQEFTMTSLTYSEFISYPGTAPGSNQVLAFRNKGIPSVTIFVDDLSWEPLPACPPPTSVSVGSITTTSASVSFVSPGGGSSFILEYGAPGFTPGIDGTAGAGGTIVLGSGSPIALTGLASATSYDVYIRRNCGAGVYSNNSLKVTFSTLCNAVNVPYSENFDGVTIPNLPVCTSRENLNGDPSTWTTITAPTGYTGNTLRYIYHSTNAANDWFYTRGLNLTGGTTYYLSFKYGNNSTFYVEKMKVHYGSAQTVGSMTNLLADYPSITGNTPIQISDIPFTPSTTGVYYIGFHAYSIADQFYLYLDDINVVACTGQPTAVSVGSITTTSASVSFTSVGTSFIVEYGAPGFTPGTGAAAGTGGTIVTGSGSPIALTGLTPSTSYDVYVRKECAPGSHSANSLKVTFTTACTNATLPLNEGFNTSGTTVFPSCWTQQQVVGTSNITFQASSSNPTTTPYEGTRFVYWNSFSITAGNETRLVSRAITTTGVPNVNVEFQWYNENSTTYANNADGVQVQFSYDGSTWSDVGPFILRQDLSLAPGTGQWKPKSVALPPAAGNQLTIYVGFAFRSAFGNNCSMDAVAIYSLAPTPPPNDNAPGAILLTVGSGCIGAPLTNLGATQSASEPFAACQGVAGYKTVWYRFLAPASGNVRISSDFAGGTMGSDSRVALFSAETVGNYATFTNIACDDDNGSVSGVDERSVLYATGLTPGTTYYIQVDGKNALTTAGTFCLAVDEMTASMISSSTACAPGQDLTSVNNSYTGLMSLTDVDGKLIALINNPSGGAGTSTYATAMNVNAGPVRQDGGKHYLDRNFLINNASVANVNVQFFFLSSELAALQAADPAVTLSNLQVTRQTGNTCDNNFVAGNGTNTSIAQTGNGSATGFNWILVQTPGFSKFYLHTKKAFVPLKTFLHGAYLAGQGRHKDVTTVWRDRLNASALVQPYNAAPFNYTGTENVPPGFFTSTAGVHTDPTDWILVELRSSVTPATVIARRAGFILENGRIVDINGTSDINFGPGIADGNYHIVIRHRNHMAIRTPNTALKLLEGKLGAAATLYDYSTAQAQAYQNPAITLNTAQRDLLGGVFGMWGGNANSDGFVRATGLASQNDYLSLITALGNNPAAIIANVYNRADLNLDGTMRATGLSGVNDYLFLVGALDNNPAKVITQHQ